MYKRASWVENITSMMEKFSSIVFPIPITFKFEVVCLLFDWLLVTRLLSSVEPLWYRSMLDRTWSSFVSLVGVWSLLDLRDDSSIIWCFCSFVKIDGCVEDAGSRGVCEREP